MIDDREALYRTICENPENDTPRLVFADWLQEHGEETRSEFIRVQCRLADMNWDDPGYVEMTIEEDWQRHCHGEKWQPPPEEWESAVFWIRFPSLSEPPRFSRGFADWPGIRADDEFGVPVRVNESLSRIVQETPARQVMIWGSHETATHEILRLPAFGPFVGLECDTATDAATEVIAEEPHFSNLRQLVLEGPMTDRGLGTLAESRHLSLLRNLSLVGPTVTQAGFGRFLRSDLAAHLHALTASQNNLGNVGMASSEHFRSIASATLPRLRALSWETYENITQGFHSLLTNEGLPELRSLELVGNDFPARDLLTWRTAPVLRPIRLVLEIADVDEECVHAMMGSALVNRLEWLEIRSSRFRDAALSALSRWEGLTRMRRLLLDGGKITAQGLGDLLGGVGDTLGWLSIHSGRRRAMPKTDFVPVLERLHLPNVRWLGLHGLPIGDRGAEALAVNGSLSRLRTLELTDCDIGNEGAEALVESPHLSHVERFDLRHNPILYAVRARLAELPGVIV